MPRADTTVRLYADGDRTHRVIRDDGAKQFYVDLEGNFFVKNKGSGVTVMVKTLPCGVLEIVSDQPIRIVQVGKENKCHVGR